MATKTQAAVPVTCYAVEYRDPCYGTWREWACVLSEPMAAGIAARVRQYDGYETRVVRTVR